MQDVSCRAARAGSLALLALAIGMAACAGPAAAPRQPLEVVPTATGSTPGLQTVRAGRAGTLGEAGQLLAESQGYFVQEGLAIDVVKLDPANSLPPLVAGQIDVAGDGLGSGFFNAVQGGVDIHIVATQASNAPNAAGGFLVVRRDLADSGRLHDYADLKGLKIAIPAHGNSGEYGLAKAMQLGGLTLADADIVELNFQAMVAALASKAIDVASLPEPLATVSVQNGSGVKWRSSADYVPGGQGTVVVFSPQFVAQRDVATRWMTAYIRGIRDYNDAFVKNLHRPQTIDSLASALSLNSKLFNNLSFTHVDPDGKVNLSSVEDLMHWYVQMGYVSGPVDLSRVVDTSFTEAAVAKLGPYQ